MTPSIVSLLRCLNCGAAVTPDGQKLTCSSCRQSYEIRDGVGIFLSRELEESLVQSEQSFSAKWNRTPDMYDDDSFNSKFKREWYLTRYHWKGEDAFRDFLSDKALILDAGSGLGHDIRWYASLRPGGQVVGADLSEAVFHAARKAKPFPNISVIRGDLYNLPFAPGTFDYVVSDQVLSNVSDPPESVRRLWKLVRPGGHMAFYVYKQKAPIREFTDDLIRRTMTTMTPEQGWEESKAITELGRTLSALKAQITLNQDIPTLGMKAGTYDLQRFIYYNILKCFWNDNMTFDQNNQVTYDWFHPAYTFRYSPEDVEVWTKELGMNVLVLDRDDQSGVSVLAQKHG